MKSYLIYFVSKNLTPFHKNVSISWLNFTFQTRPSNIPIHSTETFFSSSPCIYAEFSIDFRLTQIQATRSSRHRSGGQLACLSPHFGAAWESDLELVSAAVQTAFFQTGAEEGPPVPGPWSAMCQDPRDWLATVTVISGGQMGRLENWLSRGSADPTFLLFFNRKFTI